MAKSTRKKSVPANETAEQRFVRLAEKGTITILKKLKSMSNLRGTRAVSTAAQRDAINSAVTKALAETLRAMAGQKIETTGFKLS